DVRKEHDAEFPNREYVYDFLKYCEANFDVAIFFAAPRDEAIGLKRKTQSVFPVWQAFNFWNARRGRHLKADPKNAPAKCNLVISEGNPPSNFAGVVVHHDVSSDWRTANPSHAKHAWAALVGKKLIGMASQLPTGMSDDPEKAFNRDGKERQHLADYLKLSPHDLLVGGYAASPWISDFKFHAIDHLVQRNEVLLWVYWYSDVLVQLTTLADGISNQLPGREPDQFVNFSKESDRIQVWFKIARRLVSMLAYSRQAQHVIPPTDIENDDEQAKQLLCQWLKPQSIPDPYGDGNIPEQPLLATILFRRHGTSTVRVSTATEYLDNVIVPIIGIIEFKLAQLDKNLNPSELQSELSGSGSGMNETLRSMRSKCNNALSILIENKNQSK
ncbi:MAG: hypothetical protein AAFP90_15980, partial [Planctomycetota bacterium]